MYRFLAITWKNPRYGIIEKKDTIFEYDVCLEPMKES